MGDMLIHFSVLTHTENLHVTTFRVVTNCKGIQQCKKRLCRTRVDSPQAVELITDTERMTANSAISTTKLFHLLCIMYHTLLSTFQKLQSVMTEGPSTAPPLSYGYRLWPEEERVIPGRQYWVPAHILGIYIPWAQLLSKHPSNKPQHRVVFRVLERQVYACLLVFRGANLSTLLS